MKAKAMMMSMSLDDWRLYDFIIDANQGMGRLIHVNIGKNGLLSSFI